MRVWKKQPEKPKKKRAGERRSTAQQKLALGATAEDINGRVAAAQAEAQNSLREQLAREVEAAQGRLQGALEGALHAVEERAAGKLREQTHELRTELREEAATQSSAVRESLESHTKHIEETVARANQAAERLNNLPRASKPSSNRPLVAFNRSSTMSSLFIAMNCIVARKPCSKRFIHEFAAASNRRTATRWKNSSSTFNPWSCHTSPRLKHDSPYLAGGRSLLDAALTMQQDRIRNSADEAFAEALGRFRENLGTVEQVFNDSAHTIATRNLDELEGKAADLKHHALEEMLKSAEWYEKKAQSQMQHQAEKVVDQASTQIREKAGEVSSLFTNELSHASNSYMTQAHQQLEETVRDSFERVRMLFTEAADTTSAAFTDEIQRNARQELDGFTELMNKSVEESRERLDAARELVSHQVSSEQTEFLRRFQKTMGETMEQSLHEANGKVQATFSSLSKLGSPKVMRNTRNCAAASPVSATKRQSSIAAGWKTLPTPGWWLPCRHSIINRVT